MMPTQASQIKVGLLILSSLVIFGLTTFLMGKERRLFENRVSFEIHFSRTTGLRDGAPISLTGVTVGSVESLSFPRDIRERYILVRIRVAGDAASRVRKDTVARIRTVGLLGDKYIELSGGSSESEPLPPGGRIASIDPVDYEALLGESGDVVQNFIAATASLKNILGSIAEGRGLLGQLTVADKEGQWAEAATNLRSATGSLRNILRSVEKGEGTLGQLIKNREAGEAIVEDLRVGVKELRKTSESLHTIVAKLEKGEGTLGTLIQDPRAGREILDGLRRTAANLESVSRQLREGGGIFQRLISDRPYADRVLQSLERTARDLARITGKIERGEGTIGALINDPELYQETREAMGSLRRSWLFSIYRFFRGLIPSGEESPKGENKTADQDRKTEGGQP